MTINLEDDVLAYIGRIEADILAVASRKHCHSDGIAYWMLHHPEQPLLDRESLMPEAYKMRRIRFRAIHTGELSQLEATLQAYAILAHDGVTPRRALVAINEGSNYFAIGCLEDGAPRMDYDQAMRRRDEERQSLGI